MWLLLGSGRRHARVSDHALEVHVTGSAQHTIPSSLRVFQLKNTRLKMLNFYLRLIRNSKRIWIKLPEPSSAWRFLLIVIKVRQSEFLNFIELNFRSITSGAVNFSSAYNIFDCWFFIFWSLRIRISPLSSLKNSTTTFFYGSIKLKRYTKQLTFLEIFMFFWVLLSNFIFFSKMNKTTKNIKVSVILHVITIS